MVTRADERLGASVFTADEERSRKIAAQIDSGMVFINRPFGTAAELRT